MPLVSARIVSFIKPDGIAALAFAGEDQSVLCASAVQLNGQILGDDLANHTFEWEQTFGTPVTLINPNTLSPSFINPQVSDIEFTLYVDRNTPFEDSDSVFISRAPESRTGFLSGATYSTISRPGNVATQDASFGSVQFQISSPIVGGAAYNYPPARYNPIYKASDFDRIRFNVDGQYWLMNDIDLSEYDNWNPIGTLQRPFSGELQGNGYSIQNLSITETPIAYKAPDPSAPDTAIYLDLDGTNGDTIYTDDGDNNWNFVGASQLSSTFTKFGSTSFTIGGVTDGSAYLTSGTPSTADSSSISLADFGSGEFTIEFWYYFDDPDVDDSFTGGNTFVGQIPSGTTSDTLFNWRVAINNNQINFSYTSLGTNFSENTFRQFGGGFIRNQWNHIVVERSGGVLAAYINGSQRATTFATGAYIYSGRLGAIKLFGSGSYGSVDEDVYIDEVRVTIGTAVYGGAASFTVPERAYDGFNTTNKPAGLFSAIGNGALIEKLNVTDANISGVSESQYKGILAGSGQSASSDDGGQITIQNVYVDGTVDSSGDNAGGLIGHTGANVSTLIENTLSNAIVTGGGTNVGGWAGYFDTTATYNDNYWNTDNTTVGFGSGGDAPIAGEVDGRTTAELQLNEQYIDWNFDDIWLPPVTNIIEGDEFFDNVVLLLDFEGTDGDTTTTDTSNDSRSVSMGGITEIDNAQAKFGSTSALFPAGIAFIATANDAPAFVPGSNEYTIEAHFRASSLATTDPRTIIGYRTAGAQHGWVLRLETSDQIRFIGWSSGNATPTVDITSTATVSADVWYHAAAARDSGGTWRIFLDGSLEDTGSEGLGVITDPTDNLFIGRDINDSVRDWQGWIDNVRLTSGTARYTTSFTAPTEPHPTNLPSQTIAGSRAFLRELEDEQTQLRNDGKAYNGDNAIHPWQVWLPTRDDIRPAAIAGPAGYQFLGSRVEEYVGGQWDFPRFIPKEQSFALLTSGNPHRVSGVWKSLGRIYEGRYDSVNKAFIEREFSVIDVQPIREKADAQPKAYGNSGTAFITGALKADGTTNTIQIVNPRKISKQVADGYVFVTGALQSAITANTITKFIGTTKQINDTANSGAFAATQSDTTTSIITRNEGTSIGS